MGAMAAILEKQGTAGTRCLKKLLRTRSFIRPAFSISVLTDAAEDLARDEILRREAPIRRSFGSRGIESELTKRGPLGSAHRIERGQLLTAAHGLWGASTARLKDWQLGDGLVTIVRSKAGSLCEGHGGSIPRTRRGGTWRVSAQDQDDLSHFLKPESSS